MIFQVIAFIYTIFNDFSTLFPFFFLSFYLRYNLLLWEFRKAGR